MGKVAAYHTNSPEYLPQHRNVFHNHDDCPDGKRIKREHKEAGSDGKPLCRECARLG